MKKQPKAVYIIENGGYTELTYEEFRRREQICPLYADKLFLPLYGRLMEVSKEDYMDKRTDINNASFAYGINLLRMLLDMNLITQDEYERITRISAEYYDTEIVCV